MHVHRSYKIIAQIVCGIEPIETNHLVGIIGSCTRTCYVQFDHHRVRKNGEDKSTRSRLNTKEIV